MNDAIGVEGAIDSDRECFADQHIDDAASSCAE